MPLTKVYDECLSSLGIAGVRSVMLARLTQLTRLSTRLFVEEHDDQFRVKHLATNA